MQTKELEINKKYLKNSDNLPELRLSGKSVLELAINGELTLGGDAIYHDISKLKIPEYSNFFREIANSNIEYTILPAKDYSRYNFEDVVFTNTIFKKGSTITPAKNILQSIFMQDIKFCTLPEGDFSKVNFKGVNIRGTVFRENSKLPTIRNFPQELKHKSLYMTTLPNGNYVNWNLNGVNFQRVTVRENTILPKDRDLFKQINYNSIKGCIFIKKDLSKYDMDNVDIEECIFINCKFPLNRDFLIDTKRSSIVDCKFIDCDLSIYNFRGVDIEGCKFLGNTKLPKDKNLFQIIKDKNISFCHLPNQDYRDKEFKGCLMRNTYIHKQALLPLDRELLYEASINERTRLPIQASRNLYLYNLPEEVNILAHCNELTLEKTYLLYQISKYKEAINE